MERSREIAGREADAGEVPPRVSRPPARRAALPHRPTASSQILAALRADILGMRLKPGEPLTEKDLTERFGVSRTPLREALIRLAEDGLVEIFPQSGTFVGRIPVEALPEAVVVRQALECAAMPLIVARTDAAGLALLDAIIARQAAMAALGDQDAFHAADEEFHEALATLAGHPGLWRVAQQAKTQIDRCRRMTLPMPGRMPVVVEEHRAIVQALRARDARAADSAMRQHLSSLVPDVEQMRAAFPDYFI